MKETITPPSPTKPILKATLEIERETLDYYDGLLKDVGGVDYAKENIPECQPVKSWTATFDDWYTAKVTVYSLNKEDGELFVEAELFGPLVKNALIDYAWLEHSLRGEWRFMGDGKSFILVVTDKTEAKE